MSIWNHGAEFVTIAGESFDAVTAECRVRRLFQGEFSIVQPIGRHKLTILGSPGAANDQEFVVAIFVRTARAHQA